MVRLVGKGRQIPHVCFHCHVTLPHYSPPWPVTLPSQRCSSWGHLSCFWNLLGILFPESSSLTSLPSLVPERSSLVNSSGDTVNQSLRAHPVLGRIFKLLFRCLSVIFSSCCPGPAALVQDSSQLTVHWQQWPWDWAGCWGH